MSPTAGAASSQPAACLGQPGGSLPSADTACSTLPLEPATTSARPSPDTSATAGAPAICQPSTARGEGASPSPLPASPPGLPGWEGGWLAGLSRAASGGV